MAIVIRNIEGPLDGECVYEVRINRKYITQFKHKRTDGLAHCLLEAALAVAAEQDRKRGKTH